MKLTSGKLRGLKAVSNQLGIIAAVAMDQRGSARVNNFETHDPGIY
jgi:tagatose-1,6-bisphosphate aldolase